MELHQGGSGPPTPSLFVSHGTPMLALAESDEPYVASLRSFWNGPLASGQGLKGIVVVSAHGISEVVEISASREHRLEYDFMGFPGELYRIEYPLVGSSELAARIAGLLGDDGFATALSTDAPLDHGVWVPLRAMTPELPDRRIPVVRVSMPLIGGADDPRRVLKLGKALAPLRGEGILLVGSGGAVHNLGQLHWYGKGEPGAPWALAFENWIVERLEGRQVEELVSFESVAPGAAQAHPTSEHFLPLLFTIGSAWKGEQARILYRGVEYHSLSMLCFALVPEN